MKHKIKTLIENKDYKLIRQLLSNNPNLANEGIPCDKKNSSKAHPLHRICDAVFAKKITDKEAIAIAKILLKFGANIDGYKINENKDTPLMAAASLRAEQLGIFYIENGANVHYADSRNGATALHWAAFCGRDKLVEKLIQGKAAIDQRDASYNATPLGWAIQPLMTKDKFNTYHQVSCIKLLLKAGANVTALNSETIQYLHVLAQDDLELKKLLN
jgi:ankyrin repeat protein